MKEFERFCDTQEHAQEIANSRVGCLGGSDAKMVLKVGYKGIGSLSKTDIKRLRIMLGIDPREDFGGNAATNAGHLFEDYVGEMFSKVEYPFVREKRLVSNGLHFDNFTIIAHADFAIPNNTHRTQFLITECKYVQKEISKVWVEYQAQLQWYYLFSDVCGVQLCHGRGNVEPFAVSNVEFEDIYRNDEIIAVLIKGLKDIDNWCNEYTGKKQAEIVENETDSTLTKLLTDYSTQKLTIDILNKDLEETKAAILQHMEKNGIQSGDTQRAKVTYKAAGVQRRLDTAKVQSKYPQVVTDEECWKTIETKSSITIKIKENESENNQCASC